MIRFGFLVVLALTMVSARAKPLPTQVLFATPEMVQFRLSPDGLKLAFLRKSGGGVELYVHDLATKTTSLASRLAKKVDDPKRFDQAIWFTWMAPQRLMVASYRGAKLSPGVQSSWPLTAQIRPFPVRASFAASLDVDDPFLSLSVIDCLTGAWMALKGAVSEQLSSRAVVNDGVWDMSRAVFPDTTDGVAVIPRTRKSSGSPTNVYRVDLATGNAVQMGNDPDMAGQWFLDGRGNPRIVVQKAASGLVLYQRDDKGKWAEWTVLGTAEDRPVLHGLGPEGATLIASRRGKEGRQELVEYDLVDRKWREPLAADPRYDIDDGTRAFHTDVSVTGPLFSPVSRRLLGVRYFTADYSQRWFDPRLAAMQQAVDKLFSATINAIIDVSENCERALIFSWSSREPGYYSVLDFSTRRLESRVSLVPGLDPNEMGTTSMAKIPARDGTILDAYITLPPGRSGRPLPLVVLLGEQLSRRELPTFSPLLQMLATRGLAILQVNHRGVAGYGEDFAARGRDPAEQVVHQDIEDAVRWAIKAGTADGGRIAIVGEYFGGFSALYALAHSTGLYRCGVAIMPISDWEWLSRYVDDPFGQSYILNRDGYVKKGIGKEILRARSPRYFASQIKMPLLLVHKAGGDLVISHQQNLDLISSLKAGGVPFDTLPYSSFGYDEETMVGTRVDDAARAADGMIKFLLQHLGPESGSTAK